MKKIINTENAPKAIGPYSQATSFENLIFSSGQLPIDPKTGSFPSNDISKQAHQALLNLKNVLESGGSCLENVLKTTVYLSNIEDFSKMNDVYKEFFIGENFPSRSAFQVAKLPLNALIEIEAIAYKKL